MNPASPTAVSVTFRSGCGEIKIAAALVALSDRRIVAILLGDDRWKFRRKLTVAIRCHRLVKGGGSIFGYRWGVQRKRRLINMKGVA